MPKLVIPSIFKAIDAFTAPVRAMGTALDAFAGKAQAASARADRMFRKISPAISDSKDELFSFAKKATIAAAIVAGVAFTGQNIVKYEDAIANLSAVTGASGKDLDLFKSKIREVANDTKTSSVFVADAFTAVGNNMPELLKDANALAAVTSASITLAKASKMELQPASEALTQIMNQFNLKAGQAAKTIDVLAAGSVAGSSEIRDTADAIQKFGTTAVNAGIKIDEAVALVELGSRFEKGAEAGNKFKNILVTMSAIKVIDPAAQADLRRYGVNLNVVADKTLPLATRLKEISKIGKDTGAMFHVFGKENISLATGVLNAAGEFDKYVEAVNTSGMATAMAEKNTNTFSGALKQLADKWVTISTTSGTAGASLDFARGTLQFLTNHMETIVALSAPFIGVFLGIKAVTMAVTAAQWLWNAGLVAYNFITGIAMGVTGGFSASLLTNRAAFVGYTIATYAATAAQWLWNAAMTANPIGLVIIGVAALIALVTVMVKKWESWGAALAFLIPPIGLLISIIQSLRKNWDMVTEAFTSKGLLNGLLAIGRVLIDAILFPVQAILKLASHLPGFMGNWAKSGADSIEAFRGKLGTLGDQSEQQNGEAVLPVVNNKAAQNEALVNQIEVSKKQNVELVIRDESGRAQLNRNTGGIPINLSSTMPAF